jgi:inner membrane protein
VRDQGHAAVPGLAPPQLPPSRAWTAVEFTDLRFDYAFLATRGRASVLGGWVYIVDNRDEAGEILNGRVQR